jgi:hypothetical protein
MPTQGVRCRHRQSWLLGGAMYEWCYECGAFRSLRPLRGNAVAADSPWCCPSGRDGANPWKKWEARRATYRKRRATHEA